VTWQKLSRLFGASGRATTGCPQCLDRRTAVLVDMMIFVDDVWGFRVWTNVAGGSGTGGASGPVPVVLAARLPSAELT
jgi:hypothetical protein